MATEDRCESSGDLSSGAFYIMRKFVSKSAKLTVCDEVSHDEGTLADPPEPLTTLQIRQLNPLGHRQAKNVGCMRRLR